MDIYIFNRELNLIGILDNFFSLIWRKKYHKSGDFELHCDLTDKSLNLLQKENIIYKVGDDEAGFIEYINLKKDEKGKEVLVVKGKFLTSYLDRRIILGTEILNTTAESAIRTLINNNCINPINPNRVIPNLILGDLKNFTPGINYQVSYANLEEELEKISNVSNLGYKILFDISNKKLIFDIYEGKDRSINQNINPRMIFSKEFENVLSQEYTDSNNNFKNFALIAGAGEGNKRKLAFIGDDFEGLNRHEMFVDARDISNKISNDNGEEETISDIEYFPLLLNRGDEKLSECYEVQTFDSKVKSNLDIGLGDIVTCIENKWNLTINTRITELEEVYEGGKKEVNIVFGNNMPTLIDKIKSMR